MLKSVNETLLDEANKILEGVSEGPWVWEGVDGCIEGDGFVVCNIQPHGNIRTVDSTGEGYSHADARFIAASRSLISAMAVALEACIKRETISEELLHQASKALVELCRKTTAGDPKAPDDLMFKIGMFLAGVDPSFTKPRTIEQVVETWPKPSTK